MLPQRDLNLMFPDSNPILMVKNSKLLSPGLKVLSYMVIMARKVNRKGNMAHKYTLYDGPDALIANKLLHLGKFLA